MYYEVYADVLFFYYFVVEFLILSTICLVLNQKKSILKYCVVSAMVAIFETVYVCADLNRDNIIGGLLGLFLSATATILLTGRCELEKILVVVILQELLSCLLQGMVMYFNDTVSSYCAVIAMTFLMTVLVRFLYHRIQKRKDLALHYEAVLELGDERILLNALLDTGNTLVEPMTLKTVQVINQELGLQIDKTKWGELVIPYTTIEKQHGIMKGFFATKLTIRKENQVYEIERPAIGISKVPIGKSRGFDLILNANVFDEANRRSINDISIGNAGEFQI